MAGCSRGIGEIEVKAPNGKPSLLFNALTDLYQGDLDAAYRDYLLAESRNKELLGGILDVNGEPSLEDVQQVINPMRLSKPLSAFLTDSLKDQENGIESPALLPSGDQSNFYRLLDKAGNLIKEAVRTSAKITEMAYGKTRDQDASQDWATREATRDADNLFTGVKKGDKAVKDGIEYSYQEYVDAVKRRLMGGATKGTLVHLKIQEFLARTIGNKELSRDLQEKITTTETLEGINPSRYDWVTDIAAWKAIVKATGIRIDGLYPTKIHSELKVADADLGLASTIDMITEDPLTGKMRIADFKTTQRFNDSKEANTMIHGVELTPIYNTAKNRARLQVMLNAVVIKAGNPEAQFEAPVIVWLPDEETGTSGRNIFDVDVRDYLRMIENHYKSQHPEVYKAVLAKSPDIFNPGHYGAAVGTSFTQDLIDHKTGMRAPELLNKLKLELESLELEIQLRPGSKMKHNQPTAEESERREELVQKILQAESTFALPTHMNSVHEYEVGQILKWVGVLSDTNNPYLKSYVQSVSRNHAAFHAEKSKIDQQFNILLQAAVNQVFGKQSRAGKAFTSLDKAKLWNQLVDRKIVQDEVGNSRMTVGMKTEASADYKSLTPELQALSKFMRTNMKDVFDHVMVSGPGATVVNKPTGKKTKLDLYNESKRISFKMDETFIPKMGVTSEEIYQKFKNNGLFSKGGVEMLKYWKAKYLTDFFENNIEGDNQQDYGIPIKYVGTENVITAVDTHSLDLEQSFKKYMEGMLTKKHYDNAYALGMSLSGLLRSQQGGAKSADMLEHSVYRDILKKGTIGEDKLFTHNIRIGKYQGNDVYLSMHKGLRSLSRGVASIGLWANLPSMGRNAVQAEWAVQKEALLYGMISDKWSNVSAEDKDLSYKNFLKAKAKVAAMQGDFLKGKGRSNPIHIFMKEFDLYPQIAEDTHNLVTGGRTAISMDHLTAGYQHAEDMTTANLMVTALMTMKVKSGKYAGKSMWEMYEQSVVVDKSTGFGTFKLPEDFSRGKLRMGDGSLENVTGLHPLEITRLKSMTRKLKGGYRKEERSRIEATYLGEAFMLFKRWIPQVMVGNFKGKYEDISVGAFKVLEQRNGEDVLEWKARVVEGRLVTLFHVMANALKFNNSHKWEDLTSEQKKNLMDVGISFTTWAGIAILISAMFGDDDDKETKKFLTSFNSRISEHINPVSFTQITDSASIKMITNMMEALWQMSSGATMYVLTGDEEDLRTQKGDIRGLKRFKHNIPFGAAIRSAETYLED